MVHSAISSEPVQACTVVMIDQYVIGNINLFFSDQ